MKKPQKPATLKDGERSSGSPRIKTQIRQQTENLSPSVTHEDREAEAGLRPALPSVPPAARDDQLIVERLLFALRHARRGVVELGLKTAQVL